MTSVGSIASTLRTTLQSLRITYKDELPEPDSAMYEGRTYTLASARCFVAAYAAAEQYRDQVALQFYNLAVKLASALSPQPKDEEIKQLVEAKRRSLSTDDQESFDVKEEFEIIKTTLNSKRKACHTAITSNFGALTYLNRSNEENVAIYLFHEAHQACVTAHKEARSLRHTSEVDILFGNIVEEAVKSIGMFYNQELSLYQDIKEATDLGQPIPLTLDHFILCTKEERMKFTNADVNKMITQEQQKITQAYNRLSKELVELRKLNEEIAKQSEVAKLAEDKFKEIEEEHKAQRIVLEEATGSLSEMSKRRSEMRIRQTTADTQYYARQEKLQTVVNLHAQR